MTFTPKSWQDSPVTATPINAAALIDMETRLAGYTDQFGSTAAAGEVPTANGAGGYSWTFPPSAIPVQIPATTHEASFPLAANGTAQSNPYDMQGPAPDGITLFSARVATDKAGTLGIKSSPDGVTWSTEASIATSAVGTIQAAQWTGIPSQRYVQAIQTNGGTSQTSNSFVTWFIGIEAA